MARTITEAINSYITDMLALEEHIEKAIAAQLQAFEKEYPPIGQQLREMDDTINRHILTLRGYNQTRDTGPGKSVAEAVKRAASTIAGLGAAAVDLVRTEKLPKDLRDDYTAFSLASIGYLMLLSTSLSLGDSATAEIARLHLSNYARMTITMHNLVPSAVIALLQEERLPASADVLPELQRLSHEAWAAASDVPHVDEVQVR